MFGDRRVGKGALTPCPPYHWFCSWKGGHAEPVIGRALARPVGFAHPTGLPIDLAAMTDRHDQHNEAIVFDRGDDPVVAHPIAPETLEVAG
jgi:hypothetical protein